MLKEDKFVWELFHKKYPKISKKTYRSNVKEYIRIKQIKEKKNNFK